MFYNLGIPDQITHFNGTNDSTTSILYQWTPPSHLPGLEPCCISYYVNVTHQDSGDPVNISNVTEPRLSFTISEERLCEILLVDIVAYNEVGEGELFTRLWSLGGNLYIFKK